MLELAPSNLQRVRNVLEGKLRTGLQMAGQAFGLRGQRALATGGQQQQRMRACRAPSRGIRCLLQHHMRVGPTDSE